MKQNIIIYQDGITTKVWTKLDDGKDFAELLVSFYEKCGGKVTPEIFSKAIHYMTPADACNLFNQLVNDVVLKDVFMGCVPVEIYGGDNG